MIVIFNSVNLNIQSTYISICEKYMLYGHDRHDTKMVLRDILARHGLIEANQKIDIAAWSAESSMYDSTKKYIVRYVIYNDNAKKIGDITIPTSKYRKPKIKSNPITYTTNNFTATTVSTPVPYFIRFT